MRYDWFHPREKLSVYLVTRKYRGAELKHGAHISGNYQRKCRGLFFGEQVIVKTTATLDPPWPKSNGHKRFYFTVKGSGRDWDYDELMFGYDVALEEKVFYDRQHHTYSRPRRQLSFK